MFEFILKQAFDHIIKIFKEKQFLLLKDPKYLENKLFIYIQFFIKYFPDHTKTEDEIKKIISTFIKLTGVQKSKLTQYFGKDKINEYKKNYKFKNIIKYIKQKPVLKNMFLDYFSDRTKTNIYKQIKSLIKKKVTSKVEEMRNNYIFKAYSNDMKYLNQFKKKISNIRFKLPMLILDISEYTYNLNRLLGEDQNQIRF